MRESMTVEMNGKRELPKGWRWARLGNISRVVSGSTPNSSIKENWNGNICWITPTDLGKLQKPAITSSERFITEQGYLTSGTELVPPGTIVMSSRAPIGYLGIAQRELCTNQGCKSFIPSSDILSGFLYFALKQSIGQIRELGSGTTFSEVSKSQLESFEIAFPPLPEQRRIATLLHEHLAAVEKARRAAQARLEAAQALPAALLREIFESEEARGWNVRKLGDVARIGSGVTLGKKYEGIEIRPVPYLRVANVRDGFLDLSDVNEIAIPELDIEKYLLCEGDLLLTEGGDPDKLGRGTYWQGQMAECIHQNHIFRVRFDLERFSPSFLSAQLGSAYGKAYFLAFAKQTTGIATINQQVLANFPLMVPAREVQDHIATRINKYTVSTEQAHNMLTGQCHAIDAMPAALLRMAFQGEL